MKKNIFLVLGFQIIFSSCALLKRNISVSDIDGNIYKTVKIGNQMWMKENLRTIHFNNGDPIPIVKSDQDWELIKSSAACNIYNDTINAQTYGRLYNYYSVIDSRNICPAGWRVPNNVDWLELQEYLGYEESAVKMKITEKQYWLVQNISTNVSGFSAIPSGSRQINGEFTYLGRVAFWWSTDEYKSNLAHRYDVDGTRKEGHLGSFYKGAGFSVRCIKK